MSMSIALIGSLIAALTSGLSGGLPFESLFIDMPLGFKSLAQGLNWPSFFLALVFAPVYILLFYWSSSLIFRQKKMIRAGAILLVKQVFLFSVIILVFWLGSLGSFFIGCLAILPWAVGFLFFFRKPLKRRFFAPLGLALALFSFDSFKPLAFVEAQATSNGPLAFVEAQATSNGPLADFKIQTENKDLKNRLKKYFKNKPLSIKEIQAYLIENGFYLSQVVQSKQVFIIKNPAHVIFSFSGNAFFTEREILKNLKIDEGKSGPGLYDFMENEIKSLYRKKGFLRVRVEKAIQRKQHIERVLFRIFEGPRARLTRIVFKGALSRPPVYYESFVRNNSGPLVKQGFYNKKDLENGALRLINHLKGEGRLLAKIYSDRVSFEKDKAFVAIHLEEGPLVLIRDIQILGAEGVPVWEILSLMESKAQSPLKMAVLKKDFASIEKLYKSRGYLKMRIKNKQEAVNYIPGERYASLSLVIEQGPKLFVSSIQIKGLIYTHPLLVKSLLRFKEGEALTSGKRESSIQALGETGLFSDISLHEETQGDLVHLTVMLKERKRRSLKGALGLNTQRGLTGRIRSQISHNNLFGWGRSLSLGGDIELSRINKKYFFEYEILGKYGEVFSPSDNWRGDVNLSHSDRIFNYSARAQSANFVEKTNIGFFLNRKISKEFKMRWNIYSFENRQERCLKACPGSSQQIAGSKFQLLWDGRDNIFDPSRGSLSSVSIETALPHLGSSREIAFVKGDVQSRWYVSLFKKATLGLALKGGWIGALQGQNDIPVSRAFILGGRDSIRGYDGRLEGARIPGPSKAHIESANSALKIRRRPNPPPPSSQSSLAGGPASPSLAEKGAGLSQASPQSLGFLPCSTEDKNIFCEKAFESFYSLLNLELRFPLLENVKGSVFYDAGAVWMKGKKSGTVMDFGHSIGLGFRYQIFLLPLGLDIAYRIKPAEGEKSRYNIHFSIGW